MAIVSFDQITSSIAAGQTHRYVWNKQTGLAAYTAGYWYDTFALAGSPPAGTYPGAALTPVATGTSTVGWLPYGSAVEPTFNRYLSSVEVHTSVLLGVPSWLMLVDVLMYYPGINMNTNLQQTMLAGDSLPSRCANGTNDGTGVMMFLTAAATTGATPHAFHSTGFTYTNTTPTGGRTIPGTVACTVSAIVPHIVHSGIAINNFGPFIPLAAGDVGVKSVEKFQLAQASGSASTSTLVLCRPIAQVPLTTQYVSSGRDMIFNTPILPRIYDGSCLSFLLFAGVAVGPSTNFEAVLDFVWG